MSNELTISLSLGCANGNYKPPVAYESGNFNQSVIGATEGVLNCTTSAAAIPLSSVATLGYAMLKNLDLTNNIDVGLTSGSFIAFQTLKPGEFSVFRFKAGTTPQAVAAAGTPKLQYWILND